MQTRHTSHSWRRLAIFAGGLALTFVVMFALSGVMSTLASASLVLFGIAASFAAIGIIRFDGEQQHWSLGPAAVFSFIGWMFMVEAASLPAIMAIIWPVLIIAFFTREVVHSQDHGHTPAMHA